MESFAELESIVRCWRSFTPRPSHEGAYTNTRGFTDEMMLQLKYILLLIY